MKKYIIPILVVCALQTNGQTPTYRWVSGSNETQEESNTVLTEPGPRQGGSTFTDPEGNFWLYGGYGFDEDRQFGNLDDLWKYDTQTKTWSWVAGGDLTARGPAFNNYSLRLDGINDRIKLDDNPVDYSTSYTIEFWFRATNGFGTFVGWNPQEGMEGPIYSLIIYGGRIYVARSGFAYRRQPA